MYSNYVIKKHFKDHLLTLKNKRVLPIMLFSAHCNWILNQFIIIYFSSVKSQYYSPKLSSVCHRVVSTLLISKQFCLFEQNSFGLPLNSEMATFTLIMKIVKWGTESLKDKAKYH